MTLDVTLQPMDPGFDSAVLEDLRDRLRRTRRVDAPDDAWARGVPASWLAETLADWQAYDVARLQRRLAELTHLRADIDGRSVHVAVKAGRGADPLPLLLANGWPSSFLEYLDVLPLLTDPGAHGGDPGDAFTVVLPSLPGFGFSAPPPPAMNGSAVGWRWSEPRGPDGTQDASSTDLALPIHSVRTAT